MRLSQNIRKSRYDLLILSLRFTHEMYEVVNPIKRLLFRTINESQIKNKILELNSNKSAGYDDVPPRVIKRLWGCQNSPLTNLFNNSIEISLFPDGLKYAKNLGPF